MLYSNAYFQPINKPWESRTVENLHQVKTNAAQELNSEISFLTWS